MGPGLKWIRVREIAMLIPTEEMRKIEDRETELLKVPGKISNKCFYLFQIFFAVFVEIIML